jgi:hypothetical protein
MFLFFDPDDDVSTAMVSKRYRRLGKYGAMFIGSQVEPPFIFRVERLARLGK